MKIIKPKKLIKGNTIGILSVSGSIDNKNDLYKSKKYFENKGFKVVLSENIFDNIDGISGSVKTRLKNLHSFFSNENIDAIFCARGGFGTLKLVNYIDYELIKNNPKIFIGFSDITNLNAMFLKKSHLLTFYGPMPYVDFVDEIDEYTEKMFFDTLNGNLSLYEASKLKIYNEGLANGILFGGNLSSLASCCGVDFIPDENFILFIEDWHDPTYKIDRMLTQLFNIEQFEKNIKGIVVGEFLNIEDSQYFDNIFFDIAKKYNIPIASGFKISHGKQKMTLPYGMQCQFDANKGKIKMLESIFSD